MVESYRKHATKALTSCAPFTDFEHEHYKIYVPHVYFAKQSAVIALLSTSYRGLLMLTDESSADSMKASPKAERELILLKYLTPRFDVPSGEGVQYKQGEMYPGGKVVVAIVSNEEYDDASKNRKEGEADRLRTKAFYEGIGITPISIKNFSSKGIVWSLGKLALRIVYEKAALFVVDFYGHGTCGTFSARNGTVDFSLVQELFRLDALKLGKKNPLLLMFTLRSSTPRRWVQPAIRGVFSEEFFKALAANDLKLDIASVFVDVKEKVMARELFREGVFFTQEPQMNGNLAMKVFIKQKNVTTTGPLQRVRIEGIIPDHSSNARSLVSTVEMLTSAGDDGFVRIWKKGADGYREHLVLVQAKLVHARALAVDETTANLFVGCTDGSVALYEKDHKDSEVSIKLHSSVVTTLHVNARTREVISGSADCRAVVTKIEGFGKQPSVNSLFDVLFEFVHHVRRKRNCSQLLDLKDLESCDLQYVFINGTNW